MKWKLNNSKSLTINGVLYTLKRDYTQEEVARIISNRGSFDLVNDTFKLGIS